MVKDNATLDATMDKDKINISNNQIAIILIMESKFKTAKFED